MGILKLCKIVFCFFFKKKSCANFKFYENKIHPAFTCRKFFESVHIRKVAIKMLTSNLRDILYFKLAVNHTHLRTGKQIKKEFSFASVAERDEYT